MLDRLLYPRPIPADGLNGRKAAVVSNGIVHLGDFVRELPADHIQPCSCCLCRPSGGQRPAWRVMSIGERDGRVYVRLQDDYECPADELEHVAA